MSYKIIFNKLNLPKKILKGKKNIAAVSEFRKT